MSAWYSRVGDKIERHDGRRPKFAAVIRCTITVSMGVAKAEDCGIYRRDPAKYPDEPDVFAAMLEKAQARRDVEALRALMRKGKTRRS